MDDIIKEIKKFNTERNWGKFHTPSNLAKSISIESAELLECFQWDEEKFEINDVYEELADVFTYCFQLAITLDVNPKDIILNKLEKTKKKYPVDKAKGVSTKYDKL